MAVSLHFFLHYFIVIFGFTANAASIVVILRKTPRALQEYSVLLLNLAVVELLSVLNHFIFDGRFFYSSTTTLYISSGPCHVISGSFCSFLSATMNVVMMHSTALVGLSFWYR
ncbi:hypothetical protein PMAYCL1PPCAC_32862, partial [Pristionchus mayeri]